MIAAYGCGEISEAIVLVKPAVGSSWFRQLARKFPRCEVNCRIKLIDCNGIEQPRPAHGNTFFYLGANAGIFAEIFQQVGDISKPA